MFHNQKIRPIFNFRDLFILEQLLANFGFLNLHGPGNPVCEAKQK